MQIEFCILLSKRTGQPGDPESYFHSTLKHQLHNEPEKWQTSQTTGQSE